MRKGQLHPAAIVSKNLLTEGLFSLMEKKPFTEITIMELCQQAQVSRRTFYRHFSQIDEVVAYQTEGIIKEFVTAMNAYKTQSYEAVLEAYFAFWKRHAALLNQLNRNNLTYVIFTPYLLSLNELPWLFPPHGAKASDQADFICQLAYHSGGLWSVLTYWIMNDCVLSEHTLAITIVNRT